MRVEGVAAIFELDGELTRNEKNQFFGGFTQLAGNIAFSRFEAGKKTFHLPRHIGSQQLVGDLDIGKSDLCALLGPNQGRIGFNVAASPGEGGGLFGQKGKQGYAQGAADFSDGIDGCIAVAAFQLAEEGSRELGLFSQVAQAQFKFLAAAVNPASNDSRAA